MQHIKKFCLFENNNNNIQKQDFIENKGNIYNILRQINSFDSSFLLFDIDILDELYLEDFELFLEVVESYAKFLQIADQEIKRELNKIFLSKNSYISKLGSIQQNLLDTNRVEDFMRLAAAIKYHPLIGSSYSIYIPDVDFKKLTPTQIQQLLDDKVLVLTRRYLYVYLKNLSTTTLNDLIATSDRIDTVLQQYLDNEPWQLIVEPKYLTQFAKLDFDAFLQYIDGVLYILQTNIGKRPLQQTALVFLKSFFEKLYLSTHVVFNKTKTIGPQLYRVFLNLFKLGKFNEIERLYELINQSRDYRHYKIPFGAKDIETLIPIEKIKEYLDKGLITLTQAHQDRIFQEKDQYQIWTNSPSYKVLKDLYRVLDTTSKIQKRNGNLRLETKVDVFTLYSYGTVRRAGSTAKTLDKEPADNPKGAEELLQHFRAYLAKKAFRNIKNKIPEKIEKFKKNNPINTRSSYLEWEKWWEDFYEWLRYYQNTDVLNSAPIKKYR